MGTPLKTSVHKFRGISSPPDSPPAGFVTTGVLNSAITESPDVNPLREATQDEVNLNNMWKAAFLAGRLVQLVGIDSERKIANRAQQARWRRPKERKPKEKASEDLRIEVKRRWFTDRIKRGEPIQRTQLPSVPTRHTDLESHSLRDQFR